MVGKYRAITGRQASCTARLDAGTKTHGIASSPAARPASVASRLRHHRRQPLMAMLFMPATVRPMALGMRLKPAAQTTKPISAASSMMFCNSAG